MIWHILSERCQNPKIAPYCNAFVNWNQADGEFVEGMTYGSDCYTKTSENPDPFQSFCSKAYVPSR